MADNTIEQVIRLTIDRTASRVVKVETKSISAGVKGISTEVGKLGKLGASAANGVSRLTDRFRGQRREVRALTDDYGALGAAIEDAQRQAAEPLPFDEVTARPSRTRQSSSRSSRGVQSSGSSSESFEVGRAGTLFSALAGLDSIGGGALAGVLGEAGQLGDVIEGLSKLGGSLGQVAAASGIAAVALAGIALAMAEFNKVIDAGKQSLDSALTAQDAYYSALRDGLTSEEVRQRMADIQSDQPILTQQINETQSAIDSTFRQLVDQMGDAAARALIASGQTPITQLEERLKELRTEFDANNQTLTRFSQGLGESAFLQNDIAATLEKANETTQESIELIARLRKEGLQALGEDIEALLGTIAGVFGELPNDLERYNDLATSAADAQAAYNATLAEGQATVSRLAAESQAKQDAITAQGLQEAGDIAEQYNHERIQGERELARELRNIQRAAGLEQANAIGDRDAVAFHASEAAEDLETDQANEAAAERADEREYQYRLEIRQLARSIDERLRTEQAALTRSLQMEGERWRKELETRRQALTIAQQQLEAFTTSSDNIMHTFAEHVTTGLTTVQTAGGSFLQWAIDTAVSAAQTLEGLNIDALNGYTGTGASAVVQGGVTGHAAGGDVRAGEWSWVGEQGPELVRFNRAGHVFSNAQSRQIAGGGFTFAPTINGNNWSAIRRNILREFDNFVAGYEAEAA